MYRVRVIPRLDIKGPNLVKGVHLEGLRVLGDPAEFCELYYRQGADEILYMDCVASLFERNSLHHLVSTAAERTFIPLTVGGGLRTIQDIRSILKAGADKVAINTAATKNPDFVRQASRVFGSSTIVVAIEAVKQPDGRYLAVIDNGRQETGREVVSWAEEVERLGAGEILLTSVDREGTGEGFDVNLIDAVRRRVGIPVIAHGGASSPDDAAAMAVRTGAHGICVASAFHYDAVSRGLVSRRSTHANEGNTTFLKSGAAFAKAKHFDIAALKGALGNSGILCRLEVGDS